MFERTASEELCMEYQNSGWQETTCLGVFFSCSLVAIFLFLGAPLLKSRAWRNKAVDGRKEQAPNVSNVAVIGSY